MTFVWIAGVLLVLTGAVVLTLIHPPDWALKRVARLSPGTVFKFDTREPVIGLTFDDAPHPDVTPGILRELRRHNARATFFVLGVNAAAYPSLIDSIRSEGHELANHLYTDRISARLSNREFRDELMRTDALIEPLGAPKWCRPGNGIITPRIVRIMRECGYTPVAGSAYPIDLYSNVEITVRQFMENVRPGAILILHDGGETRAGNIEVLARLLPRVQEMGYRVTTLGDLNRMSKGEP